MRARASTGKKRAREREAGREGGSERAREYATLLPRIAASPPAQRGLKKRGEAFGSYG